MDVSDSVRVNGRHQKLHVRVFKPQQTAKALIVWNHGKERVAGVLVTL